ncbi:MAG: hypothetical protein ACFE0O_07990 [Opitutales bacterium]
MPPSSEPDRDSSPDPKPSRGRRLPMRWVVIAILAYALIYNFLLWWQHQGG